MKHLTLILAFFCFQITSAQQFPVGAFRITWDYTGHTPPLPAMSNQLSTIFPLLQSASFNFAIPFTHYSTQTDIQNLLNSANAHGVKIILPNVLQNETAIERFYLDAFSYNFDQITGFYSPTPDPDALRPLGIVAEMYDGNSLQATTPGVWMVSAAKFRSYRFDSMTYRASFRLKVNGKTGSNGNTPVAFIEVYNNHTAAIVDSTTLYARDFDANLVYKLFDLHFYTTADPCPLPPPAPQPTKSYGAAVPLSQQIASSSCGPNFDFRVKWLGNGLNLWLDYVQVDAGASDNLFGGLDDTYITNSIVPYVSYSALSRFYFNDEPYYTQYLPTRYVNSILQTVPGVSVTTGKGLGHAAKTEYDPFYGDSYRRYVVDSNPYELKE